MQYQKGTVNKQLVSLSLGGGVRQGSTNFVFSVIKSGKSILYRNRRPPSVRIHSPKRLFIRAILVKSLLVREEGIVA